MEILSLKKYAKLDQLDASYPTTLIINNSEKTVVPPDQTAYLFAVNEGGNVSYEEKRFPIYKHMYFSIPSGGIINEFSGFICFRENFNGFFHAGGPVEKLGRLKYIDGCSDTLLLSPMIFGDPCLNYLYVPPCIDQTPHTHPSVRIGCVVEGEGYCLATNGRFDLIPGNVFVLPPGELHSFHTNESFLRIFIYHPDSDFGPTHDIHPMINKTYKEGVSLRGVNEYRTLEIRE